MLSFATEFPIDPQRATGGEVFLAAFRKWILGSPHTTLKESDLDGVGRPGVSSVTRGGESIETVCCTAASGDQVASARYSKREKGLEWLTTVGFAKDSGGSWVGIRISCESSTPAIRLPPAKKPVLVRTLLSAFGGGRDGALQVIDKPHRLTDSEIDLAASIILGTAGCRLPAVYVSSRFTSGHIVDVDRLAKDLSGMAHVLVEPNRPFSLRLKFEVQRQNVYGGTIGVYWPDGGGRRSYFVGDEEETSDSVAERIKEEVRIALTNIRALDRCTWAAAQGLHSRLALEALKSAGSLDLGGRVKTGHFVDGQNRPFLPGRDG